jgi:DNA polymerase
MMSPGQTEEQGFRGYCKLQGIDLEGAGTTAAQCVFGFRNAYPAIVEMWDQMQYAAIKCVRDGAPQRFRMIEFRYDGGNLYMILPSGRWVTFHRASLMKNKWDHDSIRYWSHHGWWNWLHGGSLTGIATQATARDYMAEAMVREEAAGIPTLLHVHDQLVSSVKDETMCRRFAEIMVDSPAWARVFPIAADCDMMSRYAKDGRATDLSFTVRWKA